MAGRHKVRLTASFERNLDSIERFLAETDAPRAFDALLAELSDNVVPNLERFPEIGRPFLERRAHSIEVANGIDRLRARLRAMGENGELREYLLPGYLILYARIGPTIHLLSIRHHRQLSFDFDSLWAGD